MPTALLPFLVVTPCTRAIEFYKSAFDAMLIEQHMQAAGKCIAKLSIDSESFWIGDEEEEFGNVSPHSFQGSAMRMILVAANPEEIFRKAIECGATEICPMTQEDAWFIGKLKDPFGHVWEIGRPL